MKIIECLFPKQHIPFVENAKTIKAHCKDCGKQAEAFLFADGDEVLPIGWIGAWVWLRRVYSCSTCNANRMEYVDKYVLGK